MSLQRTTEGHSDATINRRTAVKAGAAASLAAAHLLSASPLTSVVGAQEPVSGGTLRYGAVRDMSVFDPHQSGGISNAWVIGNIYDKLVTFDQEGNFVGELASSFEQVDDLTYRFVLRDGVTFHNGEPFTANDVIATIDRIKDESVQAVNFDAATNIAQATAVDDFTLEIVLKELDLAFLHELASDTFYIISAADADATYSTPDNYNGTGPFTLESWEPQRAFNLVKHAGYWKPGQPYVDRVEIMPILDDGARVDALLSGELDLVEYVPWQSFEVVESAGAQLFPSNGLQSYLRLNTNEEPLTSKPLRQAISYIINRSDVNEIAFGGRGIPMTGSLQPQDSQYYVAELDGFYEQNLEKAAELIKEAGYDSPADVPVIDFQVSTSALSQQPAQVIQQQLQDFGLQLEFRTIEVATLFENRANGTYTLHMDGGGMSWPDPDYLRTYLHSSDGTSHAVGVGYSNPDLDQLLEEGMDTTDVEERKAIYRQVEEMVLDDCPMIFILWRAQAEAAAANLRGYYALPNGLETYRVDHFEDLWFEG
jgi:ABC-type transport system substrate-binding protein